MSLEVREAELEARKKCEKMVTEDPEIMAKTPAEQVWESLQKVREKWESETKAEAGQRERGGETGEEDERRMEQSKEEEEERDRSGREK